MLINGSEKQTLYLWKIMTANYPDFHKLSPSYHLRPGTYKLPLRQYFDIMNDEDCHWRAVLSISTAHIDVSDLVAVSSLKNLVALEINNERINMPPRDNSDQSCTLQERFIRSWTEMASAKGTLQHLRVLRFFGQADISPRILPLLRKLPQLQLIALYDCDLFTEAVPRSTKDKVCDVRMEGWIARRLRCSRKSREEDDDPVLREQLLGTYNRLCEPYHYDFEDMEPPKPPSLQADIPLMEFQLPDMIKGFYPVMQLGAKTCPLGRSVIILVKSLEGISSKKKRSSQPEESGAGKKRKHTMKERAGQDLAGVLGQFL